MGDLFGSTFWAHFVEIFGEPWPLQEAARPHCQSHPAPPPPTPSPRGWPGQRVNHIGWKRKRTLECHFTCSKGTAPGVIRTLPAARSQCWPPAPPPPPPPPTGPPWQPGQRVNQKPTKHKVYKAYINVSHYSMLVNRFIDNFPCSLRVSFEAETNNAPR